MDRVKYACKIITMISKYAGKDVINSIVYRNVPSR